MLYKLYYNCILNALILHECHQASLDWRLSEFASHYQTAILGADDFKHFENMTCIGTWSFFYMCHHEFGQTYWLVVVKGLMWYLTMQLGSFWLNWL
ncbi:hypothetical protein F383_15600 [Gossypium arboreum]|uniref:Uncharacterized protein n=1 Tax=Gossypium arboreum TaxID=29729 RepID=A0A0B0MG24_GOSAR|nr:hypothetical protein F383_15600 [Gossypium arboreum]